jgi:hypothetical protein
MNKQSVISKLESNGFIKDETKKNLYIKDGTEISLHLEIGSIIIRSQNINLFFNASGTIEVENEEDFDKYLLLDSSFEERLIFFKKIGDEIEVFYKGVKPFIEKIKNSYNIHEHQQIICEYFSVTIHLPDNSISIILDYNVLTKKCNYLYYTNNTFDNNVFKDFNEFQITMTNILKL